MLLINSAVVHCLILCLSVGAIDDENFCAVHLINEGVVVDGRSASFFFQGSRSAKSYRCRLRGNATDTGFIFCK